MDNVWGTKVGGIEVAVGELLTRRVPVNGGILVEQAVTISGRVFNAGSGWLLELCVEEGFLYISMLGSSVHKKAELDLFRHAGQAETTPDEYSMRSVVSMEYAVEMYRRSQEAEVEAAFAHIQVAS